MSLSSRLLQEVNFVQQCFVRAASSRITPKLSHVNRKGEANMVDVTNKVTTTRAATAQCRVKVTNEVMEALLRNNLEKGDVLAVSRVAGIQGAKRTSTLIPLCHNIPLTFVRIKIDLDKSSNEVLINSLVRTKSETGVEMEALTAVSVAALTLYDMCKAITHEMTFLEICLLGKTGGKTTFGKLEL